MYVQCPKHLNNEVKDVHQMRYTSHSVTWRTGESSSDDKVSCHMMNVTCSNSEEGQEGHAETPEFEV